MEQDIDGFFDRMVLGVKHIVELKKKNLSAVAGKLNVLNPLGILERGYSVCFKMPEKVIVKEAGNLKAGDEINVKLFKGEVFARVHSSEKGSERSSDRL
jgi:exodeoxyribonuclease VII large subunit